MSVGSQNFSFPMQIALRGWQGMREKETNQAHQTLVLGSDPPKKNGGREGGRGETPPPPSRFDI